MNTVINIRSTSGGGKTTTVRGVMAKGDIEPLGENPKKPDAYLISIPSLVTPVFVIGSYENVCGGTDSIKTQDEICQRIRTYATLGHVLVEGLLMSHTFGRYAMLDRDLVKEGIACIWAFLDTPLELCLERVTARRVAKGNEKPLNPENTISAWHANRECYKKFVSGSSKDWRTAPGYAPTKLDARWLDHTRAVEEVFSWLS